MLLHLYLQGFTSVYTYLYGYFVIGIFHCLVLACSTLSRHCKWSKPHLRVLPGVVSVNRLVCQFTVFAATGTALINWDWGLYIILTGDGCLLSLRLYWNYSIFSNVRVLALTFAAVKNASIFFTFLLTLCFYWMIRMKLLEKVTLVKLCRITSICVYIIVRHSYANGFAGWFWNYETLYCAARQDTTSRPPGSSSCQADIVQKSDELRQI